MYTVGYGGRSAGALLQILRDRGVRIVCDVRFSPRSRFVPWANYYVVKGDGPLKRLIEKAGLQYHWVGDELGNPQPKDISLRRFSALMRRDGRLRLARVSRLARRGPVCLLCAAKDPARCHRRLITEYLERAGYQCMHL